MAKPRSEEKRNAIMVAATRVIASHGLGAPTATIAEEAGVANGTLFTYFETKSDLLNALYLELKSEMATAALDELPQKGDLRKQMLHVWNASMSWALANQEKRRALALLTVSDEIIPTTRAEGHKIMAPLGEIIESVRATGPMRNASPGFVMSLMNSISEATMDFMIHDPAHSTKHCRAGFDALWRAIA